MSYTYEQRKRPRGQTSTQPARASSAGPVSAPLRADTAGAGNAAALEAAMQARMNSTFGDLSAVRDYRPPARTEAPAPAGPYTGPVTHALSDASPSPSAAGPMQASRRDADAQEVKKMQAEGKSHNEDYATPDYAGYQDLKEDQWETKTHTPNWFSKTFLGKKDQTYKTRRNTLTTEVLTTDQSRIDHDKARKANFTIPKEGSNEAAKRISEKLKKTYGAKTLNNLRRPANPGEEKGVNLSGLMGERVLGGLMSDRGRGFQMSEEEAYELMDKLYAPQKMGMSPQEQKEANDRFDQGMIQYKGILLDDLKHKEKKYGSLVTQMHPEDILPQLGENDFGQDDNFLQDTIQVRKMGGKYLDPKNKDDQKFITLTEYYNDFASMLQMYKALSRGGLMDKGKSMDQYLNDDQEYIQGIEQYEPGVEGPRMSKKQLAAYQKDLKERSKKESYLKGRLFGRFKK